MKTCIKCGSVFEGKRCLDCRRIYMARFYEKNMERIKSRTRSYSNAHPEEKKARDGKYYQKNNETIKARVAEYRKAHPKEHYEANKRWAAENPGKINASREAWNLRNPEYWRIHDAHRRAKILEVGGTFTKEDIEEMFNNQNGECAVCRIDILTEYHIDHIMPLFLGGSNGKENLQLLCPHCNLTKGAKHPDDFMAERMQV